MGLTIERYLEVSNISKRIYRDLFVLLLFYGIATVFRLYLGGDIMYEMRKRKPEPTLLLTQGISNLPHFIGMVQKELAFDDTVSYTQWGNVLQHSGSDQDPFPYHHNHQISALTN